MIGKRDWRSLGWLALLLVVQFAPVLFTDRTYFLRDLTYINHPWRSLAASYLHAGSFPLWNPHAYLGMPLAANMQSGVLYPLSLPFYFFSWATALKLYHLLHFGAAAFLCYLWLRSWRLGRAGSTAAAVVFALGGILLSRLEFLNLLAVLAVSPAFLLFGGRRGLTLLAFACGFLAGHPQTWAALIAESLCLVWLSHRSRGKDLPLRWGWTAAGAVALCACAAIPFLELTVHSARALGLDGSVILARSLSFRDLAGLATPLVTPLDPAGARYEWWRALYVGLAAGAAALWGMRRLSQHASVGLGLLGAGGVFLCLGASVSASAWVWIHLPPFNWVRYPGNFSFLILLPLLPMVAAGLTPRPAGGREHEGKTAGNPGRPWMPLAAVLISIELLAYGAGSHPTQPRGYYHDRGPMVAFLQERLAGHRFLLSPLAANEQRGHGKDYSEAMLDIKHRMHGLSFLPYRLSSAEGAGEPLVPAGSVSALERVKSRPSAQAAADLLSWLDVRYLLVPGNDMRQGPGLRAKPPGEDARVETTGKTNNGLRPVGQPLWEVLEVPRAGRAFYRADRELPVSLDGLGPPPAPLDLSRPREDAEKVLGGSGEGWVILSRSDFPGWDVWINGQKNRTMAAFGTFPAVPVPAGSWDIRTRYRPASWMIGLLATLALLTAAGIYLYNLLRVSLRAS